MDMGLNLPNPPHPRRKQPMLDCVGCLSMRSAYPYIFLHTLSSAARSGSMPDSFKEQKAGRI